MRLALAAVLICICAMPAIAQQSIADQAQRAYDLFAGGLSQQDYATARYGNAVLGNIAGKWVGLSGPAHGTGIETYGADTERLCAGTGTFTLTAPDPFTLTLTARPAESEFRQTYTLIAGSSFAESTDAESYFEAIGIGLDKVGPQFDRQRALALSLANGMVQIYRPSDDILVIARDKVYPTILARCAAR